MSNSQFRSAVFAFYAINLKYIGTHRLLIRAQSGDLESGIIWC
jgi:hypothetical protein